MPSSADDPLSWVVSLRENTDQRINDVKELLLAITLERKEYNAQQIATLELEIAQIRVHYDTVIATLEAAHQARIQAHAAASAETFRLNHEEARLAREADQLAVHAALVSAEKAVDKAEAATERRFEAVNGFRAQLNDQTKTFMTRNELTSIVQRIDERIQGNSVVVEGRLVGLNAAINTGQQVASDRTDEVRVALENRIAALADAWDKSRSLQNDRVNANALAVQDAAAVAQRTFLPREEYTARHDSLIDQISALRSYVDTTRGQSSAIPTQSDQLQRLSAEVSALRNDQSRTLGRSSGAQAFYGYLVGVAALAVSIAVVIINASH